MREYLLPGLSAYMDKDLKGGRGFITLYLVGLILFNTPIERKNPQLRVYKLNKNMHARS